MKKALINLLRKKNKSMQKKIEPSQEILRQLSNTIISNEDNIIDASRIAIIQEILSKYEINQLDNDLAVWIAAESDQSEIASLLIKDRKDNGDLIKRAIRYNGNSNKIISNLINWNLPIDQSLLDYAILQKNWEISLLLIEKNLTTNCSRDHYHLIYHAIKSEHNYNSAIKYLMSLDFSINLRNLNGNTLIHFAIKQEKWQIVELLIAKKADINIYDNRGRSPLHSAIAKGHANIVLLLLKNSIEKDLACEKGTSLLFYAIENGTIAIVQILIDHNARVNVKDSNFLPIEYAILHNKPEIFRLLLKNAAEINTDNSSNTACMYFAIESGNIEIVQILMEYHAEINVRDDDLLFLPHAILHNKLEIVELLLRNGADINAKNSLGETALNTAIISAHEFNPKIVTMLLRAGAKTDGLSDTDYAQVPFSRRKTVRDIFNYEYARDIVPFTKRVCKNIYESFEDKFPHEITSLIISNLSEIKLQKQDSNSIRKILEEKSINKGNFMTKDLFTAMVNASREPCNMQIQTINP